MLPPLLHSVRPLHCTHFSALPQEATAALPTLSSALTSSTLVLRATSNTQSVMEALSSGTRTASPFSLPFSSGEGDKGWGGHGMHAFMACAAYQAHQSGEATKRGVACAVQGLDGAHVSLQMHHRRHLCCMPAALFVVLGKCRLPGKMRAMAVAEPVLVGARLSIALRARRRSLFLLLGASITV